MVLSAGRPARRRHRSVGLLQRGVLRAAEAASQWPIPPGQSRPRTKEELIDDLNRELQQTLVAVDWNFSQNIRNIVKESLSGVRGENSVKIIGPDLAGAGAHGRPRGQGPARRSAAWRTSASFRIMGQSNLTLPVDRHKCCAVEPQRRRRAGGGRYGRGRQGLQPDDRGRAELRHHPALPPAAAVEPGRDPRHPRGGGRNTVANSQSPGQSATPVSGATSGPSPTGTSANLPPLTGSGLNATMNDLSRTPRRRLGDLVTPLGPDGRPDPRRLVPAAGGLRHLPRAGRTADRHQVRHPRPRPGRRRGRGQAEDARTWSRPLPAGMERRIPGDGAGRIAADDRHSRWPSPWWSCCCTWPSARWSTC